VTLKTISALFCRYWHYYTGFYRVKSKSKIFCIGWNKTGTTSLQKEFHNLGFVVGQQVIAEQLMQRHFFNDNLQPILDFCKSAQVFQDVPFNRLKLLEHIDRAYPNSRFILTERDSPEQWYHSLIKFHAKLFGKNGQVPTGDDLLSVDYIAPGFTAKVILSNGTSLDDPYHKSTLINKYLHHNQAVKSYFKDRPDDLLVINLSEEGAYQKFIHFLGISSPHNDFPWENKT
tara:strand:- start:5721 stop:6410 length:690 start_codon:yes stop_codon:yes gene_type:complete